LIEIVDDIPRRWKEKDFPLKNSDYFTGLDQVEYSKLCVSFYNVLRYVCVMFYSKINLAVSHR
jgi:hypothetical protein